MDEGIATLKAGIESLPEDMTLRLSLANVYLEKGKFNQAIDQSQKSIGLNRHDPRGWISLGMAYLRQEKFEHAERVLSQALSILPQIPELHLYLGMSFLSREEFKQASTHFRQVEELSPEDERGWNNLS